MCGIFGYVGATRNVWSTAATALQRLEYRGYDSWGIAWAGTDSIQVSKDVGRIGDATTLDAESGMAIGHTRWATHGGVTPQNAHPHLDSHNRLGLVHNGIVENIGALRDELGDQIAYRSETDSEVIVHLIEREIGNGPDLSAGVASVFARLEGCNAIVVMQAAQQQLVVAKRISPMVVGLGHDGAFVASDALALTGHCDSMWVLPDNSMAVCDAGAVRFFDVRTRNPIEIQSEPVPVIRGTWQVEADSHFMDLEMRQQPEVLRTVSDRDPTALQPILQLLDDADEVLLTGCGSALFAARLGAHYFRTICGIRASAVAASELEAELDFVSPRTLVVALSQSGETADVVDAMLQVQRRNLPTAALVNVMHSTLARMVDAVVPLEAGPEQCVLATKSWMAKVALLLRIAQARGGTERNALEPAIAIERLLNDPALYAQTLLVADRLAAARSILVVGKGMSGITAHEMALKIKEASYVHAEAFAAGELKHGAIALVEPGTPCLIVGDAESTSHELHSRGGYTIGIGTEPGSSFDEVIELPELGLASPLAHVLIAQMLAYRTALARGVNPDRPRNLAKSVTVK